jgi:hypothetical protein
MFSIWVRDQDGCSPTSPPVIRPGEQLVAQCGSAGNIESVMPVLRDLGASSDVVFATPEETRQRLIAAGFTDVETWAAARPRSVRVGGSSPDVPPDGGAP